MAVANRETVQDAIAASLTSALTTVEQVYDHQAFDFGKQSPVIRVLADGSMRSNFTAQGNRSEFYFMIQVWVLQQDDSAFWTPKNAEEALNGIEAEIGQWLQDNRANQADWGLLTMERRSDIARVTSVEGEPFLVEDIPIRVEVFA